MAKHPVVLDDPEPPDCELKASDDNGIEFGVEFWVGGIDNGKRKYCSEVRLLIWNAHRDAGVSDFGAC